MKKLLTIIVAFIITASATVFANNETLAPTPVEIHWKQNLAKPPMQYGKRRGAFTLPGSPITTTSKQ